MTDYVTPITYGADPTGVSDSTSAFNSAISSGYAVFVPAGTYRLNSAVNLADNVVISGSGAATVLKQYGTYLFAGTASLTKAVVRDMQLQYAGASTSPYTAAISLQAHRDSQFSNLSFEGYDNLTILERLPQHGATFNTTDNVFRDWHITKCFNLDIAIGLEGYYERLQGNGSTTVITTTYEWPEQLKSSVVVLKETSNRDFVQLALTTDYTVSYAGSSPKTLTVTLTSAPSSSERIHVWPAQNRVDAPSGRARRPISNNVFENVRIDNLQWRGHQTVRWVDAEWYKSERLILQADSAICYVINPFNERDGEGGDEMIWESCVLSNAAPTPSTSTGIHMGPGSLNNVGKGVIMDGFWVYGGVNNALKINAKKTVALTGTVATTSGNTTIVGTGTKFTEQLTAVGNIADVVTIGNAAFAISSVTDDTHLVVTAAPSSTLSGLTMNRVNWQNDVTYDFTFSTLGENITNSLSNEIGRVFLGSRTNTSGTATIASSGTSVTVTHGLRRTPVVGEIMLTAHTGLGGRSLSVSNLTSTTFQIDVSSAAASAYTIGWRADLGALN